MKQALTFSFGVHLIVFCVLFFYQKRYHSLTNYSNMYEIELANLPISVEQLTKESEKSSRDSEPLVIPKRRKKVKKTQVKDTQVAKKKQKSKAAESKVSDSETSNIQTKQKVKVNTKNFPYAYYLSLLQYRLQENWQPPFQNNELTHKFSVVIGFQVQRNGKIINITLENSSGRALFDQSAQRAVYLTNKLPPLPNEFPGDHLSVHISFEGVW